jgi:hypothetical protein
VSSQKSEQVLTLLRELATLKELDNVSADRSNQQRRAEIAEEIKTIAETQEKRS